MHEVPARRRNGQVCAIERRRVNDMMIGYRREDGGDCTLDFNTRARACVLYLNACIVQIAYMEYLTRRWHPASFSRVSLSTRNYKGWGVCMCPCFFLLMNESSWILVLLFFTKVDIINIAPGRLIVYVCCFF